MEESALLTKLATLEQELATLDKRRKDVCQRRDEIKEQLQVLMKKNNKERLSNSKITVELEKKSRSTRQPKKAREEAIAGVLRAQGLQPTSDMIRAVMDTARGEREEKVMMKSRLNK